MADPCTKFEVYTIEYDEIICVAAAMRAVATIAVQWVKWVMAVPLLNINTHSLNRIRIPKRLNENGENKNINGLALL